MVRRLLLFLPVLLASCGFDTSGLAVRRANESGPRRDGAGGELRIDSPRLPLDLPVPCTVAPCIGCCINNVCHPGNQIGLCGSGGGSCIDCRAQACVAGSCTLPPAECQTSAHCAGDLVCVPPDCVPAYGRDYTVTVVSAEVAGTWDLIWPWLPDAFCVVKLAESEKLKTAIKVDTSKPMWNESVVVRIEANTPLRIECFDDDIGYWESIGKVEWAPVPASVLKAGTVKQPGSGSLAALVVTFKLK